MGLKEAVRILIIDNDLYYRDILVNYFKDNPQIDILQAKIASQVIKDAILKDNPDVLLIGVENLNLIDSTVFEELNSLKSLNFEVVLFSNSNLLRILQDRTVNNLNDLPTYSDILTVIRNYISNKKTQNKSEEVYTNISNKFIAFQTFIGLRFINKKNVVFFEYSKDEKSDRRLWEAHLDNSEIIKLKINTSAKDIIKHFENHDFIQISQSNIVNMHFFSSIELKSRKCILLSPYESKEMVISRAFLNEIKSRFEID